MYLRDEIYHKSFDKSLRFGKSLLNTLSKNDSRIDHKSFYYTILLLNGVFHEFNFSKNMILYISLLKDLAARQMTINSANADQRSFIIDLMHG